MEQAKNVAKPQELLSEFIGTFCLVFAVGCNVITGTAAWAVTSIACTLMVSIYALGSVSGANFNPAVSFALGMNKTMGWGKVAKFIAAQLVGGIVAGIAYAGMFWDVFNLAPAEGYNGLHAGLAEFFYTFLLVFCVLNTAVSKNNGPDSGKEYFGLAIGFSVIAGGYGAGHISGGCFNPAVAVGIDVSSAGVGFGWCIAYTIFELIGAAAAVVVYQFIRPDEKIDGTARTKGGRFLCEFLGTFFLVLTVGLNVIGGSKAPVWSIAASLMCVIFCMGDISGGHFNPAVTLAITISKRLPEEQTRDNTCVLYMVCQILGGIVAGFTYSNMEKGQCFPLAPGAGHTWLSAYLAEMVFTFMLCYVVLSIACCDAKPCMDSFFAFAIASCVTAGGYGIGAISGGSLNPAVSIGIAVSSIGRGHGIFHMIPYVIFEFLGGAIAAGVFGFTHKAFVNKA